MRYTETASNDLMNNRSWISSTKKQKIVSGIANLLRFFFNPHPLFAKENK